MSQAKQPGWGDAVEGYGGSPMTSTATTEPTSQKTDEVVTTAVEVKEDETKPVAETEQGVAKLCDVFVTALLALWSCMSAFIVVCVVYYGVLVRDVLQRCRVG